MSEVRVGVLFDSLRVFVTNEKEHQQNFSGDEKEHERSTFGKKSLRRRCLVATYGLGVWLATILLKEVQQPVIDK